MNEMVERAANAMDELRLTEMVYDRDAVCTTCRGHGGHLRDCSRLGEPWPHFEALRPPTPSERARAALLAALDPEDEALVTDLAAEIAAAYITCWPVEQTANAFALMHREQAMVVARTAIAALQVKAQGVPYP